MSINNGIVSAPLGWPEMASLMHAVLDEGRICLSDNVNIWSKAKPQKTLRTAERVGYYDNTERDADFKQGRWGLDNIPYFTDMYNMIEWMRGDTSKNPVNGTFRPATSWTWRKPTIYRICDFEGYDHNATPIVAPGVPKDGIKLPYAGTTNFTYPLAWKETEIRISDLSSQGVFLPTGNTTESAIGDFSKFRLGLVLIRDNRTPLQAAVIMNAWPASEVMGEAIFSIDSDDFNRILSGGSGDFTAFLFLGIAYTNDTGKVVSADSDIMPIAEDFGTVELTPGELNAYNGITGLFYPFPMSVSQGTISIATSPQEAISTSISGQVPTGSRSVSISYRINNLQNTGIYLEIHIEMITNGVVYERIDLSTTGRTYIGANGTLSNTIERVPLGVSPSAITNLRLVVDIFQSETATQKLGTMEAYCSVVQGDYSRD